jgi:hypothetical protein
MQPLASGCRVAFLEIARRDVANRSASRPVVDLRTGATAPENVGVLVGSGAVGVAFAAPELDPVSAAYGGAGCANPKPWEYMASSSTSWRQKKQFYPTRRDEEGDQPKWNAASLTVSGNAVP